MQGCPQCNEAITPLDKFCGACGYSLLPTKPEPTTSSPLDGATIRDIRPLGLSVERTPETETEVPAPSGPNDNRTLLGMQAPDPAEIQRLLNANKAAKPSTPKAVNQTMLGMPITKLQPGPAQSPPAQPALGRPAAAPTNRTMLGMPATSRATAQNDAQRSAIPQTQRGAAYSPTPAVHAHSQDPIAHTPQPDSLPPPKSHRGLFVLAVVLAVAAIGVVAGVGIWYANRAPVVAGSIQVTGTEETLVVTLPDRPEGTTVVFKDRTTRTTAHVQRVGGQFVVARVPLRTGEAVVGDNRFDLLINGEKTVARVLLAYRIKVDLTGVGDTSPTFAIIAEAPVDATVEVDGVRVPLDSSGKARHTVPITGPLNRSFAWTIRSAAAAQPASGRLEVIIGQTCLAIGDGDCAKAQTSPTFPAATTDETIVVRGKVRAGSVVTVNGGPASVTGDSFVQTVPLVLGPNTLSVRAQAQGQLPTTIGVSIERLSEGPLGRSDIAYDVLASDATALHGARLNLTGRVFNIEQRPDEIVVQLDSDTGCRSGKKCPVWISYRGPVDDTWSRVRVVGDYAGVLQYQTTDGNITRAPKLRGLLITHAP